MKNLYKNVVRSFSKNKISLIGLSFLTFFGVGSFCVLNNTTTNITTEYNSIASEGAMHDLTISELYDIGTPSFGFDGKGMKYNAASATFTHVESLWLSDQATSTQLSTLTSVEDVETYAIFPIPEQQMSGGGTVFTRDYHLMLNDVFSTGLYKNFATTGDKSLIDFHIVITDQFESTADVPASVKNLQDALSRPIESWSQADCSTLVGTNIFQRDFAKFNDLLSAQTTNICNVMTTTDTPMEKFVASTYPDVLEYRRFKSINITASSDSIYYKVIDSNPTDTIDKMVMFEDENKRTGNQLFNENDFAPFDSELIFYDELGNVLAPGPYHNLVVPKTFADVATQEIYSMDEIKGEGGLDAQAQYLYSQIMQIRFKRMYSANNSLQSYTDMFKILAGIGLSRDEYHQKFITDGQEIYNEYVSYKNNVHDGESETVAVSANESIVFTWTNITGVIYTSTITNWTSRFSVINPQHMKANNKFVLDPKVAFANFLPFTKWYEANYQKQFSGEIQQDVAIKWFNSLTDPQFNFWIDPFSRTATTMVYDNIPGGSITVERGTNEGQWAGIDYGETKKYTVDCSGFNQIIWGCGLTPDFMFPVVDISRPTPNVATECLTYCNESGYKTIKLAFINASVEEYLVCKFIPNTKTNRQDILDQINNEAHELTIYPKTTQVAYFATDINNVLNASSFRIAYIPSLVAVVQLVTLIMSLFIGILCVLICAIIIKRYVENSRITIGVMRANGISKAKIVLSLLPFALLPSLIGGIAAYLVGFFLQAPALVLLSNYWMLPTTLLRFNIFSFLGCILLPFIVFAIISSISTLSVLRTKAVDLMKAGSEFKASAFSRWVKKPFKNFGIMTRFRVSLAFNSLLRLLMLAIMSTLTMSSLVFAMTTFDRLSQSQQTNSSQFDYNFSIDLTTPTSTGGPYAYYNVCDPETNEVQFGETTLSEAENFIYNTQWNLSASGYDREDWFIPSGPNYSYNRNITKPYQYNQILEMEDDLLAGFPYRHYVGTKGSIQLPNIADKTGQAQDLMYLQNRINSKLLLDYNIGLGDLSSNPWEIALAMMPANSRNIAADAYKDIINDAGHKVKEAKDKFFEYLRSNMTEEQQTTYLNEEDGIVRNGTGDTEWTSLVQSAREYAGEQWAQTYYYGGDSPYWLCIFPQFFTLNEDDTYSLIKDMWTIGWYFSAFNESFIRLLRAIYSDLLTVQKEYAISYGVIPLNIEKADKPDETYTYINGIINYISSRRSPELDLTHEIKIEGIQDNSEYIHLTDQNNEELNDILFAKEREFKDRHAIIVNSYVAHKYKIRVGDTFKIKVTNDVERYVRQYHPDKFNEDVEANFEVVGVSRGTNNEAFYTTQKAANDIVGLPNGETWNRTHKYMLWSDQWSDITGYQLNWTERTVHPKVIDLSDIGVTNADNRVVYNFNDGTKVINEVPIFNRNVPVGFNGIYTLQKQGKPITSMLPLYSYTGLYPGSSIYQDAKMKDLLMFGNNLSIANFISGVDDQKYYDACEQWLVAPYESYGNIVEGFITDLKGKYGTTVMVAGICGAMDVAANDLVYKNLISTFNLAEIVAIAIIIPITIIIVGVISNLIVNDSKRMAAMLKALGYGDMKNAMSILALFIPTVAIGLLLAIPVSFGLVAGYQAIIFSTANILVDVSQKWWYYVVAVAGIGAILVGTYAAGYVSLKKDRLVDQIK